MSGKIKKTGKTNIRLANAIEKHFGSTANMCRTWHGLEKKKQDVSDLIHLRLWPYNEDYGDEENFGKFKTVCALIAEALGTFPEKLFPTKIYLHLVEDNRGRDFVRRVLKPPAKAISPRRLDKLTGPDIANHLATANELKRRIRAVTMSLSHREREIIKLRFGLGDGYSYTLDEVSHIFKVTRSRIRQIEAKAIRKLQQPNRSKSLVGFLD